MHVLLPKWWFSGIQVKLFPNTSMRLVCTRRHEEDWCVPHLLHFTDVVCLFTNEGETLYQQEGYTSLYCGVSEVSLGSVWKGQRSLHTPRVATTEPSVCHVLCLKLLYRHTHSLCRYARLFFHLYWDTIRTVHPNHSPLRTHALSSSGPLATSVLYISGQCIIAPGPYATGFCP